MNMNMVALIPARGGSKRVPGKNKRMLGGKPLFQWTTDAAAESGVFSEIIVSTDERLPSGWAYSFHYRKPEHATDDAPDILWVRDVMTGRPEDSFAILRPTSPFRTAETIRRAHRQFFGGGCSSLRAVEKWTGTHPGKMWYWEPVTLTMSPVLNDWTAHAPYHSSPTQSLVPVYRQNASLEMACTRVLHTVPPTISGSLIAPFFTEGHEGFDINTEDDWKEAERLMAERQVTV